MISELDAFLRRPPAERLRDGLRVVIAGPPNAGKSSLLNALAGRDAAITSAIAGTTRDLVEAPTAIGGTPFLLIDTAGLRDGQDEIETIGVERARASLAAADLILWLGAPENVPDPERSILVHAKADLAPAGPGADVAVSARTGEGLDRLVELLAERAQGLAPGRRGGRDQRPPSCGAGRRARMAERGGIGAGSADRRRGASPGAGRARPGHRPGRRRGHARRPFRPFLHREVDCSTWNIDLRCAR